jgi:zinc protease
MKTTTKMYHAVMSSASRRVLENGLTVLYARHTHLPVVAIEAFVNAGQLFEAEECAGVAALTGRLLDEGTTQHSAFEIAEIIESIGGSLHTQSRGASAQVLAEHLPTALELVAEVLRRPVFEPHIIEKERGRMVASLESDEDTPSIVGYNLFNELVYGQHPYHRPSKGYRDTVQAISREDILTYYTEYFVPNNTVLAIVGDVPADTVSELAQKYFGDWASQSLSTPPTYRIPTPTGGTLEKRPRDKAQTHIYLGHPGITRMNPDYYALSVMEHILGTGPGFTDRISRKLRDEQGLAYTVYANITMTASVEPGTFMAYIATSPEHTRKAIDGMLNEIRRIRSEPVSSDELDVARNYLTGSYVFSFETTTQLARYLIEAERFQLGRDFLSQYPSLVHAVTSEDIMRVAQQYLDPENYYVAIAGATEKE